ncbi:MAG: hypothetical protein FWE24_03280 [Defluviitaleaceae bacterium]|nr:hypothetical protein [Defluviitaleaceae bacterium]
MSDRMRGSTQGRRDRDLQVKKSSYTVGILIILVGVIILVSIIGFALFTHLNTHVYFDPQRRAVATRLFESSMNTDLINDYPMTPEEVMTYYFDLSRLIYSGMIVDRDLYPKVITQMRHLFGPELIALNSFEEQFETVMDVVDRFAEYGIFKTGWEKLPPIFDVNDPTVCYIRAKQTFNTNETFYWQFRLERIIPQNQWRIIRFDSTDEDFNIIR